MCVSYPQGIHSQHTPLGAFLALSAPEGEVGAFHSKITIFVVYCKGRQGGSAAPVLTELHVHIRALQSFEL